MSGVVIFSKGEWKIGGFGFSYHTDTPDPPLDIREYERNPNMDIFQFIANTEFLGMHDYKQGR